MEAAARERFAAAELQQRCETISGDFFQSIPSGGDIYLLKYIIHDWDDDDALRILRNCRRAMAPGSKLLLVEVVLPAGSSVSFGKAWMDLEMMVMLKNGKERTQAEFQDLLAKAGLTLNRVIDTRSELSILESVPADQAA